MKTEVMKYQTLDDSITSFEERKDRKGKDTFDLRKTRGEPMRKHL